MKWLIVPLACVMSMAGHLDTGHQLLPLPTVPGARPVAAPTDPDHFTFVVCGDNRAAGRDIAQPPTAGQIFSEMRNLQPSFVLWTGDSIYGSEETVGEAEAEYDEFLGLAAKSGVPVFNAPGNHEIFDRTELERLYERKMGRLYGSFNYGNSHFIALNTEEIGLNGGIGKPQRIWLEEDLAANSKAAHIFVFMHHPLFAKVSKEGWSDAANRDEVHGLFVKFGVKDVFAGHEHLYYRSTHDGVNYTVSGGGGAPSDAAPQDGGFQHYILFQVDGPKVTEAVLQPWRTFVTVGPVGPDGACSAVASNYNNEDLAIYVDFPENALTDRAAVTAAIMYKGKRTAVDAAPIPSRRPGVKTVRVVVKAHRSVVVSIKPVQ